MHGTNYIHDGNIKVFSGVCWHVHVLHIIILVEHRILWGEPEQLVHATAWHYTRCTFKTNLPSSNGSSESKSHYSLSLKSLVLTEQWLNKFKASVCLFHGYVKDRDQSLNLCNGYSDGCYCMVTKRVSAIINPCRLPGQHFWIHSWHNIVICRRVDP